ncbi:MAG: HepT-like ribonuclease domain-containing protein [Synechococcus sp.]
MGQPSRQYSSAYLRLRDMQANIVQIKTALTPITFEEFAENWILYSAIERGIERISEASRGIPNARYHRATVKRKLVHIPNELKLISSCFKELGAIARSILFKKDYFGG